MSFESWLEFGKIGEGYIARWFQRRGYQTLPVYEKEIHEGKGPTLFCSDGTQLVAPDLLVFNSSKVFWIEAKTKSAFTKHRITGRWVTGIDLHHYKDYLKVAQRSPWPIYLLFLHFEGQAKDSPPGCPTGLFGGELGYLSENENHRHDNWGKSGMVYWAHETLTKFAELGALVPQAMGAISVPAEAAF